MPKRSVAGIINIDSLFFIGKRLPIGQMASRWEFPGGKVEYGETDQQALIREFSEEFMTLIKVGDKISEVTFEHNNETVILTAYEVFLLEDNISWILAEHTDVNWVSLDLIKTLSFVDSDIKLLDGIKNYFEKKNEENN